MSMAAILSLLVGAVLGLRFTFVILVPVIALAGLAIVAAGVAGGLGAWSVLLAIALIATSIQIGYLGGVFARYAAVAARAQRLRMASPRTSSALRKSAP